MCVAGDFSHTLSSKKSARNQDYHQKWITNHKCSPLKRTDGIIIKNNRTEFALNNKCDFHSVTNKVFHHVNEGFHHHNDAAKTVILCFDKDTFDHKNEKNVILNQKQSGVLGNTINKSNGYEKHLNDINHLKNELLTKFSPVKDTLDEHQIDFQGPIGSPTNVNIHKTNGYSKSVEKTASNPKSFSKSCRQVSNEPMAGENHFIGSKLHDKLKYSANIKIVPNIIINGNSTHLFNKMANAVDQQIGKFIIVFFAIAWLLPLKIIHKIFLLIRLLQTNTILFIRVIPIEPENEDKKLLLQLKREQTVKDLTQKLSNLPLSPQEDKSNRIGDMSGLISKAKEELAKNKSKSDAKAAVENDLKKPEPKKSEIEMHWEELVKNMDRDLTLCDLDFTDLTEEDEVNILMPRGLMKSTIPPPPPLAIPRHVSLATSCSTPDSLSNEASDKSSRKTKKTVKLIFALCKIWQNLIEFPGIITAL